MKAKPKPGRGRKRHDSTVKPNVLEGLTSGEKLIASIQGRFESTPTAVAELLAGFVELGLRLPKAPLPNSANLHAIFIQQASEIDLPDRIGALARDLAAALRGVEVRILIPEKPDNALVRLSAFSYLRETEIVGIQWFRHRRGFMHQKVMLVDDDYCAIGTANFDNRSFRLNFEITMVFYEHAFAQQVADMLARDFADSTPAAAHELDRAGFWFRLKVRVARLMAPVQ